MCIRCRAREAIVGLILCAVCAGVLSDRPIAPATVPVQAWHLDDLGAEPTFEVDQPWQSVAAGTA